MIIFIISPIASLVMKVKSLVNIDNLFSTSLYVEAGQELFVRSTNFTSNTVSCFQNPDYEGPKVTMYVKHLELSD